MVKAKEKKENVEKEEEGQDGVKDEKAKGKDAFLFCFKCHGDFPEGEVYTLQRCGHPFCVHCLFSYTRDQLLQFQFSLISLFYLSSPYLSRLT